jgi:hypothetical protein
MLKRVGILIFAGAICIAPCGKLSAEDDAMDNYKKDTEEIWKTGESSEESTESSIAASMLGWGLGLAIIIGVTFSLLHND